MYTRLITRTEYKFLRLVLSQSNAVLCLCCPAAATRQFLLKTEFNAPETRIEEHMRARSDLTARHGWHEIHHGTRPPAPGTVRRRGRAAVRPAHKMPAAAHALPESESSWHRTGSQTVPRRIAWPPALEWRPAAGRALGPGQAERVNHARRARRPPPGY